METRSHKALQLYISRRSQQAEALFVWESGAESWFGAVTVVPYYVVCCPIYFCPTWNA